MAAWVVALGMAVKYGGVFSNMALQWKQAEHQQEMADRKAKILRAQAQEAQRTRSQQEGVEREDSARKLAKMEARYAKSGLAISGTPIHMMEEQAEIDEFNIQAKNRASEIWAQDRLHEADLAEWQGEVGKTGAAWGMAGSLLQAVGSDITKFGIGSGGKTQAGYTPYGKRTAPTISNSAYNYGGSPVASSPYGFANPQMNTIRKYSTMKEFSLGN